MTKAKRQGPPERDTLVLTLARIIIAIERRRLEGKTVTGKDAK